MNNWYCYLLKSVDSNKTYIGATNNLYKRLNNHNSLKYGAKYTRGENWYVILVISGFKGKRECLSFETGWHKINKRRKKWIYKKSLKGINNRIQQLTNLLYLGNSLNKWINMDLTINILENINIEILNKYNINSNYNKMLFMNH